MIDKSLRVRPIGTEETFPLRRDILRTDRFDLPLRLPGDDDPSTVHLGASSGSGPLLGIATLFHVDPPFACATPTICLRQMAVATTHRGRGIGEALFSEARRRALAGGVASIWAEARQTALAFYLQQGMRQLAGTSHTTAGVEYCYVVLAVRSCDSPARGSGVKGEVVGGGESPVIASVRRLSPGVWMPERNTRFQVERLPADDWKEGRALRLKALASEPDSFGGSLHTHALWVDHRWIRALSDESWYVARVGGRAVGLAIYYPLDTSPDGAPQLGSMWVDPQWRGSGIATALVAAIEREAVSSGAAALGVWITAGNDRARRLYLRLGYSSTGAWKPAPRDSEVGMERLVRTLPVDPLDA